MAEPQNTELQRLTLKLNSLKQKMLDGDISLEDYGKQLKSLQDQVAFVTSYETQIDKDLGEDTESEFYKTQETLAGESDKNIVQSFAVEEQEKDPTIDYTEAFRRGRERLQTQLPQYSTGEFTEPIPKGVAVSDVIDPVRGLIRDPVTGKVREGTKPELYKETFFRQRIPDPISERQLEESLSAKYRDLYNALQDPEKYQKATRLFGIIPTRARPLTAEEAEDFVSQVRKQDESRILPDLTPVVPSEVIETELFGDIEVPKPPITLVETPIMWAFRQLNKPSAIMVETLTPIIQKGMETIGLGEEPKIRKDQEWYKETEIEGVGGQVITNMLANQGIMSKQQAQLLPPDSDYDGLLGDLLISETPLSLAAGVMAEVAAPATEPGLIVQAANLSGKTLKWLGKLTKSKTVQKAGQFVESPVEYIKYEGAKKETDMALRSITDDTLTASKIEKEMVDNGGTLNRSSLRDKAASAIGDVYGQHQIMRKAIKDAKIADDEIVNIADFKTPNSPYLRSIFKNQNELRGSTLKYRLNKADEIFEQSGALGKRDNVALRGAQELANDVEQSIMKGKVPLRNKELIKRSINKTKLLNTRAWDLVEDFATQVGKSKAWEDGKFILQKIRQGTRPTADEIIGLGKIWDTLDESKVWDSLPKDFMKTQENIYLSVRYAVEDFMLDKFLKNIPDDYIYVNKSVAVPLKNKKNKVLFGKYANEMANNLDYTPRMEGTQVLYDLQQSSANNVLALQKRSGLTLPRNILEKVQESAQGGLSGLSVAEYRALEQGVSGELGMQLLEGVRLQEAGLTARVAEMPEGALRTTLISAGRTSTSFVPSLKGVVNALRLIIRGPKVYGTALTPIDSFFAIDDLPASFQQFNTRLTQAHKSSIEIVVEGNKPPRGVNPVDHINNRLQQTVDDYISLRSKRKTIREQKGFETPAYIRSDFVKDTSLKTLKKNRDVSNKRKILQLTDKYGRDNINQMLSINLGKSPKEVKFDDLLENLDYIQQNMEQAQIPIQQRKLWDRAVDSFFVARSGENSLRYNWANNLDKVIRLDNTEPFWIPNNIKPLTIENFKQVIDDLRKLDNSLNDKGLTRASTTMIRQEEAIMLPLMKIQIEVQRMKMLDNAVDDFIATNPDMLVDLRRTQDSTLGLQSVEQIADYLDEQFKQLTVRATKLGLDKKEVLNTLFSVVRETLFDGMAKDIWDNSSFKTQQAFFKSYFENMIQTGNPIITNIDDWVVGLYAEGTLTSKTFDNVTEEVNNILMKLEKNLKSKTLTKEQERVFNDLKMQFPLIVDSMRSSYIRNLTLNTDNGLKDGLFTQQLTNVSDYLNRYGINNNILVENVKALSPRLDYLGEKQLALMYGKTNEKMMKQIVDMCKYNTAPEFMSRLEKRFAKTASQRLFTKEIFKDVAMMLRRHSITQLLSGLIPPTIKFMAMNRVTASFLMMASVASGTTNVKTLAQFAGLSLTLGTSKLFSRLTPFRFQLKSNRMMYAPADEIILTVEDGALRPYTAGELRRLILEQGANFSRADDNFLDTQFEKMLIDSNLTADGLARYYGLKGAIAQRVYDNLAPGGANMNSEFSKVQDIEMRHFMFVKALQEGRTVDQAGEIARRTMLDYDSLTATEKGFLVRQIYFYSFMRTMGAETINSFYRSVLGDNFNPLVRTIRTLDLINQSTMEKNEGTDDQRSRLYNRYVKTIDGINVYAGGPVNPSISGMDFAARMSLMTLDVLDKMTGDEKIEEYKIQSAESKFVDMAIYGAETIVKGNPFSELVLDAYNKTQTGRSIPFPSELIYQAEKDGNLEEIIKMYQLVERDPTRARPLSSTGKYYDFKKGAAGLAGYYRYITHRALGLTIFADAISRNTIFGVKNPIVNVKNPITGETFFAPAALTRFHKDHLRALMLIEQDIKMPSPTGEGEVTIPTVSPYLKSFNKQEKNLFIDSQYAQYAAYHFGLRTQMKSKPVIQRMEYALQRLQNEIDEIKKKLPKE